MKNNKTVIKKIFLEGFIDLLMDVYKTGAEVIDIVVEKRKHQEYLYIIVVEDSNPITEETDVNFEDLG